MVEFPSNSESVLPVRIVSHPTDPNLRCLQDVGQATSTIYSPPGWHHVGTALSTGETGSDHVRVSPIDIRLKSSYGYFWCLGMAGFGSHNGEEKSFLSHGQDNLVEQELHLRDATRRLLDMCGVETCDFALFGGQNNLPDASQQLGTLHHSHEVQIAMAEMIIEETKGRIRPIIVPPDHRDNYISDSLGKSVLLETPSRTVHIFESLRLEGGLAIQGEYISPEKRAIRF